MMSAIAFHARVLGKGFIRMLVGAMTAGCIGLAVYGFTAIPSEGGYTAVVDFLFSVIFLAIAFIGVYVMGGNPKKGGRK